MTERPRVLFLMSHSMDARILQHQFEAHPELVLDAEWTISFGVAVEKLRQADYQALVVALDPAKFHGLQLILDIRDRFPDLPLLVLARDDQAILGQEALRFGATEATTVRRFQGPEVHNYLLRIMLRKYGHPGVSLESRTVAESAAPC